MVDHARVETQQHRFTYNEPMPVDSCTQSLCDLAIRFGEDGDDDNGERPAGSPRARARAGQCWPPLPPSPVSPPAFLLQP